MCWTGRKDNKQVAKRDFYVYKVGLVMGNIFTSLFQKHIYRIKRSNSIIPLKPVESNCGMIKIGAGYHSYKEVSIEFCQNPYFRKIYFRRCYSGFCRGFKTILSSIFMYFYSS